MIRADVLSSVEVKKSVSGKRVFCVILILVAASGLSACGSKDKKGGQSLVRVNGEEITMLQVNDELKRSGVPPGQQEAASKQLLESLIDRQLILEEAKSNRIDRSPEVMQAIESAKAQIIAQAYLQSITSKSAKPSKAQIDEYFQKHPEYFTKRKEFYLKQLVISSKYLSNDLKMFIDTAKSLDDVAAWMDSHGVQYARGQTTRSTADLPEQTVAKLMELPFGQLFLVSEGDNRVLNVLTDIKDSPVTAINAAPQIEQFLINKMSKDTAELEIAHLRSMAKIEYLNASAPNVVQAPLVAPDSKPAGAAAVN
jgi:peptidyl-prolyl cis-trans isomerase C